MAPDPKLTAFLAEVAHGRIRPDEAARQLNGLVASAQPTGDFAATDLTRYHAGAHRRSTCSRQLSLVTGHDVAA
jgi:hypothetical protein